MALNGLNFPMLNVGQEKIWVDLWTTDYNLTRQEVDSFMHVPAYLP